ncbi:response regulator [Flammeovirga sp. EKP202]|uniref:response regulator n=1 Tax=Flammeovirga sp. EKP202 TaxID=2770592 RepID=UPI00165FDB93|nr:response regulator [Flammeovirga sp. EKP202]MBD0403011.1 response regulator [Flammeovirga sp. EKP202]
MNKMLDCIICIDDDEATNYFNETVIKGMNIVKNPLFYEDADIALDYLSKPIENLKVPDLILLDLNMPKTNGWDFLDKYVTKGFAQKFNQTKIVILTTSINPLDKIKADSYECVSELVNKILDASKIQGILKNQFGFQFESANN